MAPPGKQRRGVHHILFSILSANARILKAKATNFLPVSDDPPLNLDVPKPSFANARNGSAFGFQSRVSVTASRLSEMGVPEVDDWAGAEDGEDEVRSVDADMDIDEDSHGVGLGMIHCRFLHVLIFFVRTCHQHSRSRGHSRFVLMQNLSCNILIYSRSRN